MPKFRKKPVVIDAYQLPAAGQDVPESFEQWCDEVGFVEFTSDRDEGLIIQTLEGDMRAEPGDWIIKGVKGEFYPCKPDIFAATYHVVCEFEIVRDSDGWGDTALIRQCSADHNHDECDIGPWLKEHGFEWSILNMETDLDDDHPAYLSYFEKEGGDVSQWEPSKPYGDGWFLASVYDTEDGPQALWLRRAA